MKSFCLYLLNASNCFFSRAIRNNIPLIFFVISLCGLTNAFAGPDANEDYSAERFVTIQSKIVDGYRFDITKAPVYAHNSKVYMNVKNGEGTVGDSFILVTDSSDKVVYFERIYTPRHFVELDRVEIEKQSKADVVIMQSSGGISCCEYFHFFQTRPIFKYLGRQDAVYR